MVSSQFGTPGSSAEIDDPIGALGVGLGHMTVGGREAVHEVERVRQRVAEVQVPVLALPRGELDDHRLVGLDLEPAEM